MPSPAPYRASIADFDRLPPESRVELIAGELVYEPAPVYRHQRAVARLVVALSEYSARYGGEVLCAPIDVELGEHDVLQPDVIYISADRAGIITDKRIVGAPDLIVEILSPSTAYYDLRVKKRLYERAGVCEYWIVDPILESVEVCTRSDAGFTEGSQIGIEGIIVSAQFPNLRIPAAALFS